jgi:peptide/nickel transport system substrate-binding protein
MMSGAAIAGTSLLPDMVFAAKDDDTLNIAWSTVVPSYDQYFSPEREGMILARLIWDMLVDRDPVTREFRPLLATSWKWLGEQAIEFELRQGVKFHNGDDFDADDVVYTLNWVANPDNKTRPQIMVNWIDRVEKIDQFKVVLHTKRPFPAALEYLSAALSIYPKDYYEKVGSAGMSLQPVGTGPYKVESSEPGKTITLVRNDGYFEGSPKGRPAIGRIVQRTIPEAQTQVAELLTGRVDWIWRVPVELAERLQGRSGVNLIKAETMRIGWLTFDASGRTGVEYFKDIRVRKAVAHAINRPGISKNLMPGSSEIASVCFPEQFGCTEEVERYEYNPEKAKALLAEAGYPDGFDIDFYAYTNRQVTEAMIGDLRAVGIRANLVYLQYIAFYDKVINNQVALGYYTTGSYSIYDWSVTANIFFTGKEQDYTRDAEIMAWANEADRIGDPKRREELYTMVHERIAEQCYALPLTTDSATYATSDKLDFKTFPDETPRFYLSAWR